MAIRYYTIGAPGLVSFEESTQHRSGDSGYLKAVGRRKVGAEERLNYVPVTPRGDFFLVSGEPGGEHREHVGVWYRSTPFFSPSRPLHWTPTRFPYPNIISFWIFIDIVHYWLIQATSQLFIVPFYTVLCISQGGLVLLADYPLSVHVLFMQLFPVIGLLWLFYSAIYSDHLHI